MKFLASIIFLILFVDAKEFKNDLQYETSPYLLQHATNPIHWMPWGKKAFNLAKKQNKPIFLSIGYSTCHWCHVMAKESFTNEKIAKLFNKNFINIKVDREEMPHLDIHFQELYLKHKQKSGGWPLNVFLTGNKKPFYISTYIPAYEEFYSEGLTKLLPRLALKYKTGKIKLIGLDKSATLKNVKYKESKLSIQSLKNSLKKSYDDIYGGFGSSKKFPEASKLWLLLDIAQLLKDETLLSKYFHTLDIMAQRGLYDHVDGGFYRYSVVSDWEIPHFEKMLYNQGELIPLYVKAYALSDNDLYKNVVVQSIDMLEKRFSKNHLFYSASDADSNHEEGAYFTYEYEEIIDALKDNKYKNNLLKVLKITENGNFNGKIHLNIYANKKPLGFDKLNIKLKNIRKTKEYPFIDKKINTAWNAMMIEALFIAGIIDDKYIKLANQHLNALKKLMFTKGSLYHQTILNQKPKQKALLEDYSFLISALIAGYEADFDDAKLDFAVYLLHDAKSKFYKNGIWYLSNDDLIVKADMKDKYYTSALAKMVQNILKLASLKNSFEYEKLAVKTLKYMKETIQKEQSNTPASARAFLMQKQNILTLKARKIKLIKKKKDIYKINYPYLVTKNIDNDNYLACTMRSCFAIDKEFANVKMSIMSKQ